MCGSRLAAGNGSSTQSSFFIGQPWKSTSLATMRAIVTGAYARRNSSSANVITSGSSSETLAVLGVLGEVPERRTDRRPRGVDAGDEQQDDRTAHVLGSELVALDLDLEQVAGEVVARVVDVVLHLGEDVVVEPLERRRRVPRVRR